MRAILAIARREFAAYFATPLALVFLIAFVSAAGALTFYAGGFLARRQADMTPFFAFHPWLFLALMPAIGMRLWAEERRSGTVELLMTLPVSAARAVAGKFIAAWLFAGLALALTFPMWLTVNWLGAPDNGVILASYAGSLLMAGAMLAVSSCASALTRNPVTAFILGIGFCLPLMAGGVEALTGALRGWLPAQAVNALASSSILTRFAAIMRGALDFRDVFYFASLGALFLFINAIAVEAGRQGGRAARRGALSVPLAVLLFFALNAVAANAGRQWRADLTQDGLYTLSGATRKVLAEISEPVTLRLYRSPALMAAAPALKIHAERIDGMLRNYRDLSGGGVIYEIVEPEPFSAEEDRAIAYRLRGFSVDRAGGQGYFGLAGTNAVDGLERIEFLDPRREDTLEYDLTSMIKRLAQPGKPKIGIIETLNMFGSQQARRPPWAILDIINQNYRVEALGGPLPALDGLDLLMIVHPRGLAPGDLYAIDQFALQGKPVLVFVDPLFETAVSASQQQPALESVSSNLEPLLSAWGVEFAAGKVAADRNMALRVTANAGRQRVVASYLPWLQAREANFNPADMASARLKLMRISSAGVISAKAGAATVFTPLIFTTPDSGVLDAAQALDRPNPNVFLEKFVSGGMALTLAARVTGAAVSAFPGGAPPPAEGPPPASARPHLAASAAPIHAVIVADADLLADDHVVNDAGQLISGNADFTLNLLDTLTGGADLAALRSRGMALRSFTRVEAMERSAEQLYQAREAALTGDLERSQNELQAMLARGAGDGGEAASLSREQRGLIDNLNGNIVDLRARLREVRAAGRAAIDTLETRVKLINLLGAPALLISAGLLLAALRRRRLAHYRAARAAESGAGR